MYRIKNWKDFQHYKDGRGEMPWIKVYGKLLEDPEWFSLEPRLNKTLVMLWLVASKSEERGALPDLGRAAFLLRMPEAQLIKDIEHLSHWVMQDDSEALADAYTPARAEEEVEEKKKEKEKAEKIGVAEGVYLLQSEIVKLEAKWGEKGYHALVMTLSSYKLSSGKKYKSDYHAILNWVEKRCSEEGTVRLVVNRKPTPAQVVVCEVCHERNAGYVRQTTGKAQQVCAQCLADGKE
jgi:hypothetical protein